MSRSGLMLALALALGCMACNKSEAPRKLGPAPERREPPPLPPNNDPQAIAASREPVVGPAAKASADEREQAVLRLLTDGSTAEHLPLAAER